MTEKLDLEAIEARCEAATKGPWYVVGPPWRISHYHRESDTYWPLATYVVAGNPDPHVAKAVIDGIAIEEWDAGQPWPDYTQNDADLEFCACARSDVPALVAEVRRLRMLLAQDGAAYLPCQRCHRNVATPTLESVELCFDCWEHLHEAGTKVELLRASLQAVLEEAVFDIDRDFVTEGRRDIITECRSALAEAEKET